MVPDTAKRSLVDRAAPGRVRGLGRGQQGLGEAVQGSCPPVT